MDETSRQNITDRILFLETKKHVVPNRWGYERAPDQPRPRTLQSHLPYHFYGDRVAEAGGKIVYIMRNPKDAAVSRFFYCHALDVRGELERLDLRQFIPLFFETDAIGFGNVFDHFTSFWSRRARPHLLIVFYEDLIADKATEVRKIASFLDQTLTDDQVARIVAATSFGAMAANSSARMLKCELEAGLVRADFDFYRKGQIGNWKNHFTVAESEAADAIIKTRLSSQGLYFRYD